MKCPICEKEVKYLNGHYKNALGGICNDCLKKECEMKGVMWEKEELIRLKKRGKFKEELPKNLVPKIKKSEKDIDLEVKNRLSKAFKDNRIPSVNELMGIYMLKFKGKIEGRKVKEMVDSVLAQAKGVRDG